MKNKFDWIVLFNISSSHKFTMIEKTMLVLAVLAIGILTMPAYADVSSPLQQYKMGMPINEIQCNTDKILMESPSGKPACVFEDTAKKLENRGWEIILQEFENEKSNDIQNQNSLNSPGGWDTTIHEVTYGLHGFPVVGETDELILTVKHAETRGYTSHEEDGQLVITPAPYEDFLTLKPVQLNISSHTAPTVRIYDIVSNIGSDDPYVFTPYDYETETTIAEPGKTYTVKAKIEILEEGFVPFLAIGLDGDKKFVGYAIGKDETLPFWEYDQENETYLDHLLPGLPVRGQGEPTAEEDYPLPEPEGAPVLTPEELMDEFEEGIASHHIKEDSTSEDVLEELVQHEFTIQHMRDFLENRLNYSENVINDLIDTLPNDYLGTLNIATGTTHQATFTVSGKVTAPTYFSRSSVENIHGIQVCAYDYNSSNRQFTQLTTTRGQSACIYTAESGAYVISNIINDDPNDNSNVDLIVRVGAKGESNLIVLNSQGQFYVRYSTFINNFSGSERSVNFSLTNEDAGYGRIIDTISDGRKLFEDNGIRPAPLTVNWQHDAGTYVFLNISPRSTGPQYNPGVYEILLNGNSQYTEDDSKNRHSILHEYGHNVMDRAGLLPEYSCSTLDRPGFHDIHLESLSESCAWAEGWAAFVPHLVDSSMRIQYKTNGDSVDLEQERIIYNDGTMDPFDRTRDRMNVGQSVEGQVAATLWDIKDSRKDIIYDRSGQISRGTNLDDLALGNDEIIDVFKRQLYNNFEGFYNKWESTDFSTSFNVMRLHAMAFAIQNITPTSQPQSLSVNTGSVITIQLTAQDDDPSLTFRIVDQPIKGTLTTLSTNPTSVNYLYSSDFNTSGTDRFTYTVSDGTNTTDEITVTIRINSSSSTDIFTDNFNNLDDWINVTSDEWFSSSPLENVPGENSRNIVASSNDCDTQCIIILKQTLDTTNPLSISFDRFVDGFIDRGEGLYLQYTTDNANWITLAEYTDDNRKDSDVWENESVILDISQSNANLRFLSVSSRTNEIVEIDNLNIEPITNTQPVANSQSVTLDQDTSKTIRLTGSDADNDPLRFIITTQPTKGTLQSGFASNTFANYEYTPRAGQTGTDSFRFKVNDGTEDSRTATISIRIDRVEPITFTSSLNSDGTRITLRFSERIDTDFRISDFSLSHGRITSVSNFDNSSFRYLQVSNIPYDTPITITYGGILLNLSSGNLQSGTDSTTNSLTRPDTAPTIRNISDVSIHHTNTRQITISATDAESDNITLSINGPSFVTLNNNIITINPNPSNVGTHTITVTATANGLTDTESFRVIITNPPDVSPPVFTSIQNDITQTIDSGNSAIISFDLPTANKGTVTCDYSSGSSFSIGTTTVTCIVTSGGKSASTSFNVTVEISGDDIAPIITPPSEKTFEATGILTQLVTSQIGTVTATDNRDTTPSISNNIPQNGSH